MICRSVSTSRSSMSGTTLPRRHRERGPARSPCVIGRSLVEPAVGIAAPPRPVSSSREDSERFSGACPDGPGEDVTNNGGAIEDAAPSN